VLYDVNVQRKDYSELCKFLGPKLEYVVLVRLSPLQITLYEKYLVGASASVEGHAEMLGRGGRLFNDYNFLMRICAHPWLLKLHEVREENKVRGSL
jgi:transcriptional regulator ATRX